MSVCLSVRPPVYVSAYILLSGFWCDFNRGTETHSHNHKKDGYRQQNVRQRQKLISIIDYDVCMNFY